MFRHETFQDSLFNVPPREPLPLDPGFRPLALGVRNFRRALAGPRGRVVLGLEQPSGPVARLELNVFPPGVRDEDNLRYVSWMLNGLLWVCGGWRASVGGPLALCAGIAAEYGPEGPWRFEREIMGMAFNRPFEVAVVEHPELDQKAILGDLIRISAGGASQHGLDEIYMAAVQLMTGGAEFVRELRKTHSELPVMVISGMEDAEAEYAGMDVCFLLKPLLPDLLLFNLQRMLQAEQEGVA